MTPIYLIWLLLIELSNIFTLIKWRSFTLFTGFNPLASVFTTELSALEQENVNFKLAMSYINTYENSFFYIPLQEHIQSLIFFFTFKL